MLNNSIVSILSFMQSHDKNGTWLEWVKEINNNESQFDKDYVLSTLMEWYEDSNEQVYLDKYNQLKSL